MLFQALFMCIVSVLLVMSAQAGETPLACNESGELKPNDDGVIYFDGRFSRSGGREYPFETYSLSAMLEDRKPNMCFRYEIQNLGEEKIESFRWPDIDLWWVDIEKDERQKVRRDDQTKYSATESSSNVWAFEQAKDTTYAHFTVERVEQGEVGVVEEVKNFGFFKYEDWMGDIVSFLQDSKLRVVPIASYTQPEEATEFPVLHTNLIMSDVEFEVSSEASFDGEKFTARTVTTVNGGNEVKVYAPTLLALQESFTEPFDRDDIIGFVKTLPDFINQVFELEGNQSAINFTFSASQESDLPSLFVAKHPITVRTSGRSFCIGVSSYSPIPINVNGEYCNREAAE